MYDLWTSEYLHPECGCECRVQWRWWERSLGRWTPVMASIELQRSLWCDDPHPELAATLRSEPDRQHHPTDHPSAATGGQ